MAKTREIKKRIKAVANIRRITKTMQMIATAKFSAALQRATATKPYTEGVFDLVVELGSRLASGGSDISHPLISGAASKDAPELVLVITSDRGLCGAYNSSVLRVAMGHLNALKGRGRSPLIELIGKKGVAFLRYNHLPVDKAYALGDKPSYDDVERIANDYMARFIKGEVSAVHVAYMKFLSAGKQAPAVLQLLPLKPPETKKDETPAPAEGKQDIYEFSPSAEELLSELLPAAVRATLFQAINDAVVSEHVSRMVAMKAATDNAGKMGKLLTRKYNRARQAQITTELTEIVTGAAALE
ncbi:MAG: ATP synthase F1 subunit gamma [Phycisphaerales bacterium]